MPMQTGIAMARSSDSRQGTYNLEDRTFGLPDGFSHEKDKMLTPIQPSPFTITDYIAVHMFPLAVTIVLCLIIAWSINRSIEYSELFQANHRYKWAMMACNATAVVVGSALLLHTGKTMTCTHT